MNAGLSRRVVRDNPPGMETLEVCRRDQLPAPAVEYASIAPDGADVSGTRPSPGLPFQTAVRSDREVGSEAERDLIPRATVMLTEQASQQHVSQAGLSLIESFEGFSPSRYQDSVGVWTIGYGTTSADVFPLPTQVTRASAQNLLAHELEVKYEPAVRSAGVALNENQFDALCSFVYNLGPGALGPGWTIGQRLRARDYVGVANALLLYDRAGGVVLEGLVRRREQERALFLEPVPPAPDPHHLRWFPDKTWVFDHDRVPERATVAKFYELLPDKSNYPHELARLQANIVLLRRRVWTVAHFTTPPKWGADHLGGRWQILQHLSVVNV